ncbi:MAG TPA: DUF1080 domain-containing protein [Polyangia bacterium]|jgi:hypothetical protein|nr:DUF1080 domain-containing protein [Polyangia bacterium]
MNPGLFFLAALATGALACERSTLNGGPGPGGSGAGTGGAAAVPMAMGTGGGSGGSGAGTGSTDGGPDEKGGATGGGSGGTTGSGGAGGSTGAGGAAGAENKIMLFDGSAATFNGWASTRNLAGPNPWRSNGDGTMTVVTGAGDIQSKMKFQDLFVHIEYLTPVFQESDPTVQYRGDSGVFLKGSYEMQVIDSYGQPPALDGCGAVFGISAPSSSECFQGGQWNTYEIEFKANTCDAEGVKTSNARIVSARLNGKMVQQNVDVPSATTAGQAESCNPAGLLLEDHGSFRPIMYRNIWVIPRS